MQRFIGLALGAALLTGCGGETTTGPDTEAAPGVTDTEVVLGTHTDLSGAIAIWGVGTVNGARMRFDEANKAGGVHGRQIRFVVEDTQYQVPRAIQAANKLINRDNIFAMVLAVGTPTNNAVMTQQFEQGVPNLFPVSGGRQMVEPPHRLKFTQRGIYYDEVRAAIKHFIETRGRKVPCTIYQDTDYGVEIFEGARDQATAMGLELAAVSSHKPTESEFTAAILRLKSAGCDIVAMGTVHRDTVLVLNAAKKMGWTDVDWVGNNAAYGQVIADASSGEGYYAFVHMAKLYAEDDLSPTVKTWWDNYIALYGEEPDLPAMEGYRGADLVVLALERAGRNLSRDGLIAALEGITQYTDMFGYEISFGPDKHSGATTSVLSQVRDKRWVVLEQSISY